MRAVIRFGLLILTLNCLVGPVSAGDLYLPAEYFLGRWVDGFYLNYSTQYEDGVKPERNWTAAYTENNVMIGLKSRMGWGRRYGAITDSVQPIIYLRLSPKLQIGLEQIEYSSFRDSTIQTVPSPEDIRIGSRSFDLSVSAQFVSSDSILIPESLGPYSYFLEPFVGRGALTLSSIYTHRYRKTNRSASGLYRNSFATATKISNWVSTHELDTRLLWGVLDQFNLWVDLYVRVGKEDTYRSDLYRYLDQTARNVSSLLANRQFQTEWEAGLRTSVLAPLILSSSFRQESRGSSWDEKHTLIDSVGDTTVRYSESKWPFEPDWSRITIALHYLTKGSFDQRVILDDYAGFYHKMLFAGQRHLYIEGHHSYGWSTPYFDRNHIEAGAAAGLSNHLQLGLRSIYILQWESPWTKEFFQLKGKCMVRTYEYNPESGPGWYRDNGQQIRLGIVPPAGNAVLSMDVRLLASWSPDRADYGFLAFANMVYATFDQLVSTAEIGLGRGIAVNARSGLTFHKARIQDHTYDLGLTSTILNKFRLTISYHQRYRRSIRYAWSDFKEPVIRVELQGLL